jgi:heme/copper-type cytochrome/quinol oxidase subunit 2
MKQSKFYSARQTTMNKKLWALPVTVTACAVTVIAALALAACNSVFAPPEPVTITVIAQDNKFDPATLTVRVNQPVTITLQNNDAVVHSFVIDELNVKIDKVPPGGTGSASFTATEVRTYTEGGAYLFYCDLPGYKEAGMRGNLIVNP